MRVEARGDAQAVTAGPRKQQIVLAALLCSANSPVSVDALSEALWLGSPPRTARKNIQVYLSTLRGVTRAEAGPVISHQVGGYVLHVDPADVDSLRFEQLVRDAGRQRRAESAAATAQSLAAALALWRGRALDGMRDVPLLAAAAERLDRQFLAAVEDWAEAEIELGCGASVIERVTEVAQHHPLRERLRIVQMTALCEAGRRAEALAVYDELRRALAYELGLSPSRALEEFYQAMLRGPLPAIWSAERAPCRLPWDPPDFTGRSREVRQLTDAVAHGRHRLVVVTGPLGVGKTALAVHAAHRLTDRFPDGRVFFRLRDAKGRLRPVEQLVGDVAAGDEPTDGHRAWQRWLAPRRALVILDDARRESDVRPLLPELGDSVVIVTARSRLAALDAAYRLAVPLLSAAEALEFLREVLGADRIESDLQAAERIARSTGLLPLGLRLVAERLALLHHIPLREYALRTTRAASLLDEVCAGDPTVRGRVAEAVAELSRPARRGLIRLGLLPGAVFTLSEAAAVLGADEPTTVRVLESLLETGVITTPTTLIDAHAVQYEMSTLIHAYAREAAARPGSRDASYQ